MMRLDPSEEDSDDSGNGGRDSPMAEGQMVDLEVVIPPTPPSISLIIQDNKGGTVMRKFTSHLFGLGSKPRVNTTCRLSFFLLAHLKKQHLQILI